MSARDLAATARERIKAVAAVSNNDSPDVLAFVAVRDGEAWNDRRLPEVGRALAQALIVYVPEWRPSATVPIDRRCPACGVVRAGCRSATCIRRAGS